MDAPALDDDPRPEGAALSTSVVAAPPPNPSEAIGFADPTPRSAPSAGWLSPPRRKWWAGAAALVALLAGFVVGRATRDSGPGDVDDRMTTAIALYQANRLEESAAIYRSLVAQDPTNPNAMFNLGQVEHSRQRLDVAQTYYEGVLSIDPNYIGALYNLGLVFSTQGNFGKAVELLSRANEVKPADAPILYHLGLALNKLGRSAEGSAALAQAYKLDPRLQQ